MDNASYHRRQAELCLQIAELMSDPAAAKLLREAATRHLAEASELGNGTDPDRHEAAFALRLLIGADVPPNGKEQVHS
jgi:hypothetical protein